MTLSLCEDTPGEPGVAAYEPFKAFMNKGRKALGLGPGMGLSPGAQELALKIASELDKPTVIDADALTALTGKLEILKGAPGPRVLTPHPGEAARLLGLTNAQIESDRLSAVRTLAKRSGAVVVLKGHYTLIADPSGQFLVNVSGGPVLGAAGSGDVLTGLLTGLLAQGLEPFSASALAVHIHGLAGNMAAEKLGPRGLELTEVQALLPSAWARLEAFGTEFA
jgi:NAD(P)H-hydrate epimerase